MHDGGRIKTVVHITRGRPGGGSAASHPCVRTFGWGWPRPYPQHPASSTALASWLRCSPVLPAFSDLWICSGLRRFLLTLNPLLLRSPIIYDAANCTWFHRLSTRTIGVDDGYMPGESPSEPLPRPFRETPKMKLLTKTTRGSRVGGVIIIYLFGS